MIKRVKRSDIDTKKWDSLVNESVAGLIYSLSWYLDAVSKNWDAYILEDDEKYIAALPFAWSKKYGINYVYQPFFCQQLGILTRENEDKNLIKSLLEKFYNDHKFIDNYTCQKVVQGENGQFEVKDRLTLVKTLSPDVEITEGYNSNRKRDLSKATKAGLSIHSSDDIDSFVEFFLKYKGIDISDVSVSDYEYLKNVYRSGNERNAVSLYSVQDESARLHSCGFFLKFRGRLIFLLGSSSDEGKSNGAMTFLLHSVMENADPEIHKFDFEGSVIQGLAKFYTSFGAEAEPFCEIRSNRLPWIVRLIKR